MKDIKTMSRQCNKHGEYISQSAEIFGLSVWSSCPGCADDADKAAIARWTEKERVEREGRIHKAIDAANIPDLFMDISLSTYIAETEKQKAVISKCERFIATIQNHHPCGAALFLCGNYGTGKTHLAISMLKQLLECEAIKSGLYTTAMRMIRDIRSSYGDRAKSEEEMIRKYIKPDLLVIDEVGVQNGTEAEKVLIFDVIDGRYGKVKPIILISNLSIAEMKDYLGERAVDRLRNKHSQAIGFDWQSYRGR